MTTGNPAQMSLDWSATRARRTDPSTSHRAARNAASGITALRRLAIVEALRKNGPMTAMEVSEVTGINYIETQRRMKECPGIRRNGAERDGRKVWEVMAS